MKKYLMRNINFFKKEQIEGQVINLLNTNYDIVNYTYLVHEVSIKIFFKIWENCRHVLGNQGYNLYPFLNSKIFKF